MTIFSTFSFQPGEADKYRAITDFLSTEIEQGRLAPGDRLPPVRRAAWSIGCHPGTMARAYRALEARGLAYGHVGRGTFIGVDPERRTSGMPTALEIGARIDLSLNSFAFSPPKDALAASLQRVAANLRASSENFGYETDSGRASDREAALPWLQQWLSSLSPDQVLITAGGQSGLFCALSGLADRNSAIACEALTYPGTIAAAAQLELPLAGVAMDEHGLIPAALEETCRKRRISMLLMSCSLHNPTGISVPQKRREAIAEIAERHDLIIIEDEVYGFLLPERLPLMSNLVPERTLFLTSLSKITAPFLRVGYLAGPQSLIRRATQALKNTQLMVSPFLTGVASDLVQSGFLERRRNDLLKAVQERYALAGRILGKAALAPTPSGLIWLPVDPRWRVWDFCREADLRGVSITPGDLFAAAAGAQPAAVRLSLTAEPDLGRLETGLQMIADMQADPHPSTATVV